MYKSFLQYIRDSRAEMKLVNWPTKDTVVRYTIVIVAISIASAIFLGGLDFALGGALNRFVL